MLFPFHDKAEGVIRKEHKDEGKTHNRYDKDDVVVVGYGTRYQRGGEPGYGTDGALEAEEGSPVICADRARCERSDAGFDSSYEEEKEHIGEDEGQQGLESKLRISTEDEEAEGEGCEEGEDDGKFEELPAVVFF